MAEAVTVLLLKEKDSSIAKTAITGTDGAYEFEHVADGRYFVSISSIGYARAVSGPIEISGAGTTVDVPLIQLTVSPKKLAEVTVSTQKPFIENRIDKTIVNVEASPTNTGLSALEVLEKSPGITIDNNDNINLKGKQGVVILIDGKPAYLSGKDLSNYLRNMPANQLDQVEIMTQPSAKYDASGNSGIINIKTKKNRTNGFNATITTSEIFANYFKNTNNVTFNWRKNKVNLFGNYGYSHWEGFNDIHITQSFRSAAGQPFNRYNDQGTYGRFYGYPMDFKLGADFFASKSTTIGVVINGLFDNREFLTTGVANIYDSLHHLAQYNSSTSDTKDPWSNGGINLNLRQLIGSKGKEFNADADYIVYDTKGRQYSDNYLYDQNNILVPSSTGFINPYLLKGYLPAQINIYSFKADYSQPVGKAGKLEAGIKTSYVSTDNDAQYTAFDKGQNNWITDSTRSNHFIYHENINAAYINFNAQVKKWGIQLGLRAEQTVADGKQSVMNSSFSKNYLQVFPTAYFSFAANDNNTYGLSYGRRIERPSYKDLNPFQYLLDRYTYEEGNPNLQPQFSHNIELSYNYKGQLNIAANYTIITDIINDVVKTIKDGDNYITDQTKDNIATSVNIGLAVSYNRPLTKWWTTNFFIDLYHNDYSGVVNGERVDVGYNAFSGNIGNQFNFGKGWTGELSGFYHSKDLVSSVILAQPMGMFSLGAGKQVMKNKGSVRINIRDPFYLMKFNGTTELAQFTSNTQSRWDNRRFIVTFTYRLGKTLQQQQRKRGGTDDEQRRANSGNGQQ